MEISAVTAADLSVGSIGVHLENDIESLKERIAILERRLYNLE